MSDESPRSADTPDKSPRSADTPDKSPRSADTPDDVKSAQASTSHDNAPMGRRRKRLKSVLASNWLVGIATGLISGVLVAFYLSATGQAALTAIRHGFTDPSCSDSQWLLQIPDSQVFTFAYYEQRDQIPGFGDFHVASNSIDGNLSTSWLQSWPSQSEHPETSSDYIEWSFAQPYDVRLICIVDGWSADVDTYTDTLPIGTAKVYAINEQVPPPIGSPNPSSNCTNRQASFQDYLQKNGEVKFAYQWQPVAFHCDTKNIVLRIESVSGTSLRLRYTSNLEYLVGLSEVKFYYCPPILCGLPTN